MEIEKEVQSVYWRAVLKTTEYNFIKNIFVGAEGSRRVQWNCVFRTCHAGHDGDDALVNSRWLWLRVKSLHRIRSADIPARGGEALIKFHSWPRNCWQLMAFEERVLFFSGMSCLRDYLCSGRRPCTHAHTNGTKWTVWYPCSNKWLYAHTYTGNTEWTLWYPWPSRCPVPMHIQITVSEHCGIFWKCT